MKSDDEKEMYVKCGIILRPNGREETALYLVMDMLFEECNYLEETSNIKDDIWQWEDGKYYKRVLLDSEKKLKRRNFELKKRNIELENEIVTLN